MVTLVIMDGFGESRKTFGNAIKAAKTPNLNRLKKLYPHTTLFACAGAVGLPKGQEGNSEAGHINMGAGRVVKQDLVRINDAIYSGEFDVNPAFLKAFNHVKLNNSNLHIMGLCSDGGLHSQLSHLKRLLTLAKAHDIKNIYLHLFTDGRDTPVDKGVKFVASIERFIKNLGVGKIASIGGRLYGMDRERRYDRLELAYNAIVRAKAPDFHSVTECLKQSYKNGVYDEFVLPATIGGGKKIQSSDSVIFFNYRTDRAREMTDAISQKSFDNFKVEKLDNLCFVCMTQYDANFKDVEIAFPPDPKTAPLGEVLSVLGMKQFRVSETTKYAHVTFFFNGGKEEAYPNEDRRLIETKNLKSFASFPQMRANEIAEAVVKAIESKKYDFILANLSNCDMVGHTGDFEATVKAVESVDSAIGKIYEAAKKCDADLIITADHGNADNMLTKDGIPLTSHSMSKVPFILVSKKHAGVKLKKNMEITNISSTVLKLLSVDLPKHFSKEPIF